MSKIARWSTRAALALCGTLAGVLLMELGIRLLPPSSAAHLQFNSLQNVPNGLYMNDHKVAFRPTPGFLGTMKTPGNKVDIRINSLGLRGPEFQKDDRPVWLALGDSFTFAIQVAEEQSFVGLLSQELGVQLLNAGSDGHGTEHELARFRQLKKPLSPEVVVLVFFTGNDFQNNLNWRGALAGAKKKPDQFVHMGEPKPPVRAFLNQNSLLWGMLQVYGRTEPKGKGQGKGKAKGQGQGKGKGKGKAKGQGQGQGKRKGKEKQDEMGGWRRDLSMFHRSGEGLLREGIEATRKPMQELRDHVERQGGQLMVVVASPAFAIEDHRTTATFELVGLPLKDKDLSAPERATLGLLEELNIPACPLDTALRQAHTDGERPYLAYDGHWSVLGHQIVAETIETCIGEHGLAPQR